MKLAILVNLLNLVILVNPVILVNLVILVNMAILVILVNLVNKGRPQKKTTLRGNFSHTRGGGLTQTHFFCLFAKFFCMPKSS